MNNPLLAKLLFILSFSLYFQFGVGQSIDQRRLTIAFNGEPLDAALGRLADASGITIGFTGNLVAKASPISGKFERAPLSAILATILKPAQLTYHVLDGKIMIRQANPSQPLSLKGKVTDENGSPLASATITVAGTAITTKTDASGNFVLNGVNPGTGLLVTYVGYRAVQVPAQDGLLVALSPDGATLSEVVINGYNRIALKQHAGSISKVDGEDVGTLPTQSFDQALAGRAAGVQINNTSGLIGAPVIVRIRGISSISSGSQPLIVVDGVPVVQGDIGQFNNSVNALSTINSSDIADITVLKDASAAAIYGSRGAAGVIVITTKQGKKGTQSVTYNNYFGFNEPIRKISMLNAEQYNETINAKRSNAGLGAIAAYGDYDGDGQADAYDTDWQELAFKQGFTTNHQLSVSGGNEKTSYYSSVGYSDNNNYIKSNSLDGYSLRLNLNHQLSDWLNIGINSQYSKRTQHGLANGSGNNSYGIPFAALFYFPNIPATLDGDFYTGQGGNSLTLGSIANPVGLLEDNYDINGSKRLLGNVFGELKLPGGFGFKTTYGIDDIRSTSKLYYNPTYGPGVSSNGEAKWATDDRLSWNWSNLLSYDRQIGRLALNAIAGLEYNKYDESQVLTEASDVTDEFYTELVSNAFATRDVTTILGSNGFNSYFAGVNLAYDQRYVANLTYRADAYSGYGKDHKRGSFPAVSLAWNISEENFLKTNRVLTDAKLRFSYGVTGNSNIGNYPALDTYGGVYYGDLTGLALNNAGNAGLRWEKSNQLDIGADLRFFNKLGLAIDYYRKDTRDLILQNPVSATLGFPDNSIMENVGALTNKGLELAVTWSGNHSKRLRWNSSFHIAYNRTDVTETNAEGSDISSYNNLARPGEQLGVYNLVRWAGVNPETGFAQFLDKDGLTKMYNPETKQWTNPETGETVTAISSSDRVVHSGKTYFPKFIGGFTNQFAYGPFDLEVHLQFATDYYLYNATRQGLVGQTNRNNAAEILESWTTPGQHAANQRLFYGDAVSTQASTRWLEKGDFLRGKHITLGYSFTQPLAKTIGLSSLRVYAQVQNAFTITGYSGIDPEANQNGNNNIAGGLDNYRPYQSRTWLLGLNVGL